MAISEIKGLTEEEVSVSREKFGSNVSDIEKKNWFWKILRDIITEPLFLILVIATVIYILLGETNEAIIMFVSLIFVSGISLYQENRSQVAVDALRKLSSPHAKVVREGRTIEINTSEIVKGDIIVVEDGNIISADAIILEAHDFSVSESVITGEALPVFKDVKEPNNRIYQGTMVMTGSCIAKVFAIGKQTALGKIGQSLGEIEIEKTPLQLQIKKFVRSMVGAGSVAFIIVWGINYYTSKNLLHGLLHGLTLAMSILPEEIPVAFSTFMAMGAYHLYKKKVITRSPYTVETLGAATVICVDKTGTITENEMQLCAIYDFLQDKKYDYTKKSFDNNSVLEYSMWASEVNPFDAMEKSIHEVYATVVKEDKRQEFKLVHEYPLSGTPPIMTHVFSDDKSNFIIAAKGGVEGILNQSRLTDDNKENIQEIAISFAKKGFRVLAVGKSSRDFSNLPVSQHEFEFEFMGLVAFYDPPKKNMDVILNQFYEAGITVKMITGDYSETALAIASQVNFKNYSAVLSGREVMEMNDSKLFERVKNTNIYARMFPDAKLRVIEALKSNGEVVAMTGDGVNDGPALKASHIGIAMGMRGSEIAKKAASLILVDDDLSHMVEAVALGRRIYENLKKAIQYIISIHIPIILIVTVPLLFFWKITDFFSPVHVIFLELIMGPTCSIIFENEPLEANSMQKPPRKMSATFFSFRELLFSIIQGLVITFACLGLGYYYIINNTDETTVRTIIYTTLIFCNLFLTLVNRSFYYSIFTTNRYKNKLIPIILLISLLILFLSIYMQPFQSIFQFSRLGVSDLILSFVVAFLGVIWVEAYKLYRRRKINFIN